jgi:Chaperone of endosialidase
VATERINRVEHKVPGGGASRPGSPTHEESDADLDGYTRALEQVHASASHGTGVVEGLAVIAAPGSASVRVAPGVAVDVTGRHIAVAPGAHVELSELPDQTSVPAAVTEDGVDVSTAGHTGSCVLTVQWRETFDQAHLDATGDSRTEHTPWFRVSALPLTSIDPLRVVLATLNLDAGGAVQADGAAIGDRAGPVPAVAGLQVLTPTMTSTGSNLVVAQEPAGTLQPTATGGLRLEAAEPSGTIELAASTVDIAAAKLHLHGDDASAGVELAATADGRGSVKASTLRLGEVLLDTPMAGTLTVGTDRLAVQSSVGGQVSLDATTSTVNTATVRLNGAVSLTAESGSTVLAVNAAGGTPRLGVGTATPRNAAGIRAIGGSEDLLSFEDRSGTTRWHVNQNLGGRPGLNVAETGVADGRLYVEALSGRVGIGTTFPAFTLDVSGTVCAQQFCNPSDTRLKRDVAPLEEVLERLAAVRGVSYKPVQGDESDRRQVGVLAQQVEQAFPELVVPIGDSDLKAVDYAGLAGVLVEAVHELLATNARIGARLGELERRLDGTSGAG